MHIQIIAVGKIKEQYIRAGIADYVERCRRYLSFDIVESKEESEPANPSDKDLVNLREKEAEYLLAKIKDGDYVIALDEHGQKLDSVRFAHMLQKAFDGGHGRVVFVIGGSSGLHESVRKRAHKVLSFSDMTFPHQLFRLIVCEQCYRAMTILKGQKYHRG